MKNHAKKYLAYFPYNVLKILLYLINYISSTLKPVSKLFLDLFYLPNSDVCSTHVETSQLTDLSN